MNSQELDRLDALCSAATEGPWHIGRWQHGDGPWAPMISPDGPGAPVCRFDRHGRPDKDTNDAAFISEARTALPALVARVRELEAQVPQWIPVVERLPGELSLGFSTDVLLFLGEDKAPTAGYYDYRDSYNCWQSYDTDNPFPFVTHWQPLPSPPTTPTT